jgi:hypothetical protein
MIYPEMAEVMGVQSSDSKAKGLCQGAMLLWASPEGKSPK